MSGLASRKIIDTARTDSGMDVAAAVREIGLKTGKPVGFFGEWARLMASGRMSFEEYLRMRLWDADFYPRETLQGYVGLWAQRHRIWPACNFKPAAYALASNKIASSALLSAYGLKTPPLVSLHAANARAGKGRTTTEEELEIFLSKEMPCPAFGKPAGGIQSLGSVSIAAREGTTLILQDGRRAEAKDLARAIHEAYAREGYLFQPRLVPHEAVRAVCKERTAAVRVLTALRPQGPVILRACWKIPAGENAVDNFWRAGNIVTAFDLGSGKINRAITGTGVDMKHVTAHPETGAVLTGAEVPLWQDIAKTALAGAAMLPDFGLLGWDIAATAEGPVVLEINETPELMLHQIADGRPVMDETFRAFLAERRAAGDIWRKQQRESARKSASSATGSNV